MDYKEINPKYAINVLLLLIASYQAIWALDIFIENNYATCGALTFVSFIGITYINAAILVKINKRNLSDISLYTCRLIVIAIIILNAVNVSITNTENIPLSVYHSRLISGIILLLTMIGTVFGLSYMVHSCLTTTIPSDHLVPILN